METENPIFEKNSQNTVPPQIYVTEVNQNENAVHKLRLYPIIFFIIMIFIISGIGIGYYLGSTNNNPADNFALKEQILSPTQIPIPSASEVTVKPTITINSIYQKPAISASGNNPPLVGSCQVFPADNPWNQDISNLPVNPLSAQYISTIGTGKGLHPDFGGASSGNSWGIPFITVNDSQAKFPINFTASGDESDPGPYPISSDALIEGGSNSTGDRHVLAVNTDTCILYELYRAFPTGSGWNADSGAVFDLKSNKLRFEHWTSADAAGLPIFPGLVKYDEVKNGVVNHAIRFTTRRTQRAYIHPATHYASSSTDPNLPPMGLRVRLKANYDISKLPPQAKIIATAMKKYGLILADNGSDWFFQGDVNKNWDDADINELKSIKGDSFEAVDTGPLMK